METNKNLLRFLFIFVLVFNYALIQSSQASETPTISNITPKLIPQGETTIAIIEGTNLNQPISVLGVRGGGVLAFVLNTNPNGSSITVQIITEQNAALRPREFFMRTDNGFEATGTFEVITATAPIINSIYPTTANPG